MPVPDDLERDLERLHPRSFAWALACTGGNRQQAEEALQGAYLAVLSGRARFGGRSSFKTWLFAVIRRTAAGRRRREAVHRRLLESWWRERPQPAPERRADERMDRSRSARRVRRGLAAISLRQRQVLELVFYQDLTIEEAAEVLGVSVGTARTHYTRGKAALVRVLSEEAER